MRIHSFPAEGQFPNILRIHFGIEYLIAQGDVANVYGDRIIPILLTRDDDNAIWYKV